MEQKLTKNRNSVAFILLVILSGILYTSFSYFTPRESFAYIFIQYALLCTISWYAIKNLPHISFKQLIGAGLLFRLLIAFSIPNLSNDFYRFIWDGQLSLNGFNPFLYIPNEFIEGNTVNNGSALVEGMGTLNARHYSCYPVVKQFVFLVSALFAKDNLLSGVITMRVFIILAELGILFFGLKILKQLSMEKKNILLFWLNPFVIIEMTGNVHFESLMGFFLIGTLYFFINQRIYIAAIFLVLSVMVKLIPLLFLPVFLISIYRKELKLNEPSSFSDYLKLLKEPLFFVILFVSILIVLALPFLSNDLVSNFMKSINLYFVNFEFNASIYYLLREIGYKITGYNTIAVIGKILPIVIFIGIMIVSVFRNNNQHKVLISTMLFSSSFYLLLATTVHPWYLILPLVLSVFTNFRFVILWSFMVILSYHAYNQASFHENLWFVFVEYLLVVVYLGYELMTLCNAHKSADKWFCRICRIQN